MIYQNERYGSLHLVNAEGYQETLERLMQELEVFHHADPELHQLYLETQWLLSNQNSGQLVLPTSWSLIVFRLVHDNKLKKHREAHRTASEVVRIIKKVAHCGDVKQPESKSQ